MGWCHEFGSQIQDGCDHPMRAAESSCGCEVCGVECAGRFAGCTSVWARGPRDFAVRLRPTRARRRAGPSSPAAELVPPASAPPDVSSVGATANGRQVIAGAWPGWSGTVPADTDAARNEILDWLRGAFDGVRSDLRALVDTVARSQATLASFEQAAASNRELVAATEVLPERVAAAVAEALSSSRDPDPAREALVGSVTGALAGVEAIAAELRNELVRLGAFREALAADLPLVANAVDEASARAERRLAELGRHLEEVTAGATLAPPAVDADLGRRAEQHSPDR